MIRRHRERHGNAGKDRNINRIRHDCIPARARSLGRRRPILGLVSIFAFVDRQLIYLLIDPMRASLGMSDTELSLVQGLTFILFYVSMGLPLGAMVDRYNRCNLIIAGIAIWSVMTMACGLASDFWSLFAARAGVGVGRPS